MFCQSLRTGIGRMGKNSHVSSRAAEQADKLSGLDDDDAVLGADHDCVAPSVAGFGEGGGVSPPMFWHINRMTGKNVCCTIANRGPSFLMMYPVSSKFMTPATHC